MDADGYAHYSALQNLADRAKVTLAEAQVAVTVLSQPDPNSGNPDNEGRRIERVPGGFLVLNSAIYRKIASQEDQKEQNRERARRHRAKDKELRDSTITDHYAPLRPASASENASESEKKRESEGEDAHRPTLNEVKGYAVMIGLAEWKASDFFHEMESCGWRDYNNRRVMKWQPMLVRVKTKWEADGRPTQPQGNTHATTQRTSQQSNRRSSKPDYSNGF